MYIALDDADVKFCNLFFFLSGNGYTRSEAIAAIYLQKNTEAKRVYATVIHSKTNCDGNKKEGIHHHQLIYRHINFCIEFNYRAFFSHEILFTGITFPSGEVQKRLLREVYSEAHVDPSQVAYVEAHGTGTKAGDPQELNSIVDVFCTKGRQGPLLIGSTKSNMGHPEPASGNNNYIYYFIPY